MGCFDNQEINIVFQQNVFTKGNSDINYTQLRIHSQTDMVPP